MKPSSLPTLSDTRSTGHSPSSSDNRIQINSSGALGLAGFVAGAVLVQYLTLPHTWQAILVAAATALPMLVSEYLRSNRSLKAGDEYLRRDPADSQTVIVKLLGLTVTVVLLWAFYCLFATYRKPLYFPFWDVCTFLVPLWLILAVPYFVICERRFPALRDGYWHLGQIALGRWQQIDWAVVRKHAFSWGVRAFFIPLMVSLFIGDMVALKWPNLASMNFLSAFVWLSGLIFAADLAFAVVGYALPLRIIDGHVRSTESTLLGWICALICYEPFWTPIYREFLTYEAFSGNAHPWYVWLDGYPALQVIWGSTILVFYGIFVWASVCFGPRFSNLTHRGIISFGPYWWTKHPAYISKLISFWMVAVPFVPQGGWSEALRRLALFAILCGIYRLRAVTEERHLGSDPCYREYAAEVDARHRNWSSRFLTLFARDSGQKNACQA